MRDLISLYHGGLSRREMAEETGIKGDKVRDLLHGLLVDGMVDRRVAAEARFARRGTVDGHAAYKREWARRRASAQV